MILMQARDRDLGKCIWILPGQVPHIKQVYSSRECILVSISSLFLQVR